MKLAPDAPVVIELKNISKGFPGVQALSHVSVDIRERSCHALCGENGAGKSTLGKILAGLYTPDEGEIHVFGQQVSINGPADAMRHGISIVHQELLFCENLTVAENLCLGDIPRQAGLFTDFKKMNQQAEEWLSLIEAPVDPRQRLGELSISKQQLVQIAGAIAKGAKILIFDEPTSSLSRADTERLYEIIRDLQSKGTTCVYVSHRMEEIFELCDTVTVLRDGQLVATKPIEEVTRDSLVKLMIGRELEEDLKHSVHTEPGEEVLRIENLSSPGKFEDISFSVKGGEIVALAGLVGAGRSEIAHALFGADPNAKGKVSLRGKLGMARNPKHALHLGIGLVPEDRKHHGLILSMNARENIALPTLPLRSLFGWIQRRKEAAMAKSYFEKMRVRAPSIEAGSLGLSGGNQQKLVIAKWLAADSQLLIVDEPTRGVDVGAKAEIHTLIREVAESGGAVLVISSDLPELLSLATRVIVLREGKIVGEMPKDQANEENLMRLMAGVETMEQAVTSK